jgi:predicted RNase H-like HicB family nuclease
MEFQARVEETEDGDYLAWCSEPHVQARGLSPTNALDRLRAELRYWVELCPCSGVDEDYVRLDVEQ